MKNFLPTILIAICLIGLGTYYFTSQKQPLDNSNPAESEVNEPEPIKPIVSAPPKNRQRLYITATPGNAHIAIVDSQERFAGTPVEGHDYKGAIPDATFFVDGSTDPETGVSNSSGIMTITLYALNPGTYRLDYSTQNDSNISFKVELQGAAKINSRLKVENPSSNETGSYTLIVDFENGLTLSKITK